MNGKRLQLWMTGLGLAVYMLSLVLRVDGMVLCFGQDGHVELEIAAPDMTCGIPAEDKGIRSVFAESPGLLDLEHCGSCRDIPLMLKGVDKTAAVRSFALVIQDETVRTQLFTAAHLSSYLLPTLATPPEEIPQSSSEPDKHFLLVSLRTVILLI
ncbi:MAG: hypothetical protein ACI906_002643 [Candidatus Latescibacterota bacterium]|jgi:hypothetical protein